MFEPSETVIEELTNSAFATPPSLIVTAPEDTEKLSEWKEATPLFDVLAFSPAIVIALPVAEVSIPSPPDTDNVSESKSIAIVPESVEMSTSCAVNCASTYAFILSELASLEAEADEKLSSSCIAVPLTPVLITGDVKVLLVKVDVPLSTNAFTDCWEGGNIAESDDMLSSSTTGVDGPTYVEPRYKTGLLSLAWIDPESKVKVKVVFGDE